MTTTIYDVLAELRASSLSTVEQGSRFERLMKAYLATDPVYSAQLDHIQLWSEWPGNGGKHDTGIDLVAEDRLTGKLVAIQCKFYGPDTTISKEDIDTFLSASGKEGFGERIIVSTTDRWNRNAEDAIKNQQIPVRRIGMSDLEASQVVWTEFDFAAPETLAIAQRKQLRPHQVTAIEKSVEGFEVHDRGKLIMACGTGKTFTALRLAEQLVGAGGSVLFLVPSISLLSQSLREWVVEAGVPLHPLAVCSDRKSTARSKNTGEDIATVDLALPATTDVGVLAERFTAAASDQDAMTVVFSTYQSIDAVQKAQAAAAARPFNLIVCDEAHRTTGVTLADDDESPFVKVHDADFIHADKRLYMTATPRIFADSTKAKAGEKDAVLASMDDEVLFGPEFHRLGFGEAVEKDLLSDYKVLVLAVDERMVAETFQSQFANNGELRLDDAAKIVGCWNGLAKRGQAEHDFATDPAPMRRAVAFAGTIAASKKIEGLFTEIVDQYLGSQGDTGGDTFLGCEVRHVDGTYNALERNTRLDWLRAPVPDDACRILTNARCLSEGVDVPALDAVMFLSPRKSVVDVVQSVGRVMRKAPGKRYGYVILPIGIPADATPEEALRDNTRYQVVWEVLQALRAHDERFNAHINKIDLTKKRSDRINVIGITGGGEQGDGDDVAEASANHAIPTQQVLSLTFQQLDEWRDAVYAKIVAKVGSRRYWEQWARDVAEIAEAHITRITALLETGGSDVNDAFARFLDGLRGNLNDNITRTDAIEMLAQHLITRPVFDALFAGYDFTAHNTVAQVMENMLAVLDEQNLQAENETLERFYESVRMRVDGIDTSDGRQKIIVELYDTFFATAFRRTVNKLGIAYTPVEIVDFILRSADEVLQREFGQGLANESVHILDGFTGTGTFIVRLIQSGLITSEDLARKYAHELHANEILLLAYYIAAANIESSYHDTRSEQGHDEEYVEFPGLILTDTFQSWEEGDRPDFEVFLENNERLERLKELPITVIVGNPPWSAGQESGNDNNANEKYPSLDESIRQTYAESSSATLKNSLYDSYIRAIRWATLRLNERGVIAFVTNGGWLDSNTADGMRKTLAKEFSAIYVYNLRGNQRTAGELSRREGGKIFGGGSRSTVAVTLLVKNSNHRGPAKIRYAEVADYLSREQKLREVAAAQSILTLRTAKVTPNRHGDWLNPRRDDFETFTQMGEKGNASCVFAMHSGGFKSNRDAWAYSSSRQQVEHSMSQLVDAYGVDRDRLATDPDGDLTLDPAVMNWHHSLREDVRKGKRATFDAANVRVATYRPFMKQYTYLDGFFGTPGLLAQVYPAPELPNFGIAVIAPRLEAEPAVLAVATLPDLSFFSYTAQFFPRFRYSKDVDEGMLALNTTGELIGTYRRSDNITDVVLGQFQSAYGDTITKDDIFAYVYGLLHSSDYRKTYSSDLKKVLPRIPMVTDPHPFIDGGRKLIELHLNYESAVPHPLIGLDVAPIGDPEAFFRVEKMVFLKARVDGKLVPNRSSVVYNPRITLSGIPEVAYSYMLGSRSAVEWIMDRYQVKTDKASGIVNDPNAWSREVGNPRYILDLLARIVTVSVETVKIVEGLPPLAIKPVG